MDPLPENSQDAGSSGGGPPRNAPPAFMNMGTLIGLGAALGILFGLLLDNLMLGIAIGAGLGVVFGAIVESNRGKQ